MDFEKQPVVRLAKPQSYHTWKPEDGQDQYASRHVVLRQGAAPTTAEQFSHAVNTLDVGLYHNSLGITGTRDVHFPSGRTREESARVYIPLEDRAVLTALRDLIDRALDGQGSE